VPISEGNSPPHLAIMLLHDRMKVEDVCIQITHIEGAMALWLDSQLLHPIERQEFQSRVFSLNILHGKLSQNSMIARASHGRNPEGHPLGLAPQGQGAGFQRKFNIVATTELGLDLQHLLIEDTHLLKIGGHDRYKCELIRFLFLRIKVMCVCLLGVGEDPRRRESPGSESRKSAGELCAPPSIRGTV
jgi:hypothetical protein